jgi:hypothetical protein
LASRTNSSTVRAPRPPRRCRVWPPRATAAVASCRMRGASGKVGSEVQLQHWAAQSVRRRRQLCSSASQRATHCTGGNAARRQEAAARCARSRRSRPPAGGPRVSARAPAPQGAPRWHTRAAAARAATRAALNFAPCSRPLAPWRRARLPAARAGAPRDTHGARRGTRACGRGWLRSRRSASSVRSVRVAQAAGRFLLRAPPRRRAPALPLRLRRGACRRAWRKTRQDARMCGVITGRARARARA